MSEQPLPSPKSPRGVVPKRPGPPPAVPVKPPMTRSPGQDLSDLMDELPTWTEADKLRQLPQVIPAPPPKPVSLTREELLEAQLDESRRQTQLLAASIGAGRNDSRVGTITTQRTAKKHKLGMLFGGMGFVFGSLALIWGLVGHYDGATACGIVALVVGLLFYLAARMGAWWSNG